MDRFLRFGAVGILNTIITILSYMLLISVGFNYLLANIVAYGLGVLNSYILNKNWVFKSDEQHQKLFIKFLLVNLITLGFNTASLFILVDYLSFNAYFGQIIATGFGMFINYFLNKSWTFRS